MSSETYSKLNNWLRSVKNVLKINPTLFVDFIYMFSILLSGFLSSKREAKHLERLNGSRFPIKFQLSSEMNL
jgi:hypothetical protein